MDDQNSKVLSVMKERDFYHAKVEELQNRIKVLEYDNAELVKRDAELSQGAKTLHLKHLLNDHHGDLNRGWVLQGLSGKIPYTEIG